MANVIGTHDLVGLVLMGFGNISAIYSATCSSYFSTDKFTEDDGDRARALTAGVMGFILATAMVAGVFIVYDTWKVFVLLMLINILLFALYYDVITDRLGIWSGLMKALGHKSNSSTSSSSSSSDSDTDTYTGQISPDNY